LLIQAATHRSLRAVAAWITHCVGENGCLMTRRLSPLLRLNDAALFHRGRRNRDTPTTTGILGEFQGRRSRR
jgi:hypothetical protein